MLNLEHHFGSLASVNDDLRQSNLLVGGLFLEESAPASFVSLISPKKNAVAAAVGCSYRRIRRRGLDVGRRRKRGFISVTLSSINGDGGGGQGSYGEALSVSSVLGNVGEKNVESENEGDNDVLVLKEVARVEKHRGGGGTFNTAKHLWAGAVAAMVSRTFVAPLERLKLEYIVRGEQRGLFELIKSIATSQGVRGFWKGNFVNILRTAPFKAINFYAYDTYRNQLLRLSGNKETTNFERFVAGAAAGITATVLCIPMDTIRTVMVAPGGEALGGLIGTFRHMIQTEGFFSLYKGLVPSIISMAPSGAVFYGVYDILKSTYLRSPEGRKRLQHMKQQGDDLNAFEQLELGPMRTLVYGAIAGACAEAATYPFEVVRRQLQMQLRATKMGALQTCLKIVEQGGIQALYAGLIPSLLQVLPSAAISYLVYEFMKIVLHVE
ncbi:Mitochondrial substrate carrier family protein [Perilla frutescens var. hirtella]|uniref:Mitochondrial substrate carrier family protein n=1 Tax=Perilla frutescens var. hirtella TaxID=608512 RepID=A0AAD4IUX6_PERFH|nr:Mitochondrial substrate carrier family protein [Perilla frutescens var. hirtella]KAH6808156.1 Mitochondrial substrate carrier family protein [Perilla frutescens var. frutescens]KAH6822043.1 Mitochondrial substrate carrier family protein [Perilla frutescens var. hirtella]